MPWFSKPRSSGQSWVDGPFVDLYGADLYILAFSVPILLEGRFVGVAVADVAMQDFERVLLSSLLRLDREALIINGEGRVLAANTPHWSTGEMARSIGQQRVLELEGAARWALVECTPSSRLVSAA
jgi:C4-dicarboxylate-specific signal transduction histidine kinase